jgi:hypothetical protein
MKRRDLVRQLGAIAKAKGWTLTIARDSGPHTIYAIGPQRIPVPRHIEINDHTARGIIAAAEQAPEADEEE